jgi:subtilase family serine protease
LTCELLEDRQLLSAYAATTAASPRSITAKPNQEVLTLDSTGPTGLTPEQILDAYGINQIRFSGGTITGDGAGQTIAIVDANEDPNIGSDLARFDEGFGLPNPPSFTVENLGATTIDAGWALETSLDVEWAHAIAPEANIVLVEASSASLDALFTAVRYASQLAGVSVVSMSWGTNEFSGESHYDSLFTTPAGHNNVTYVAASGDSGAWSGPMYPSVSPNVLAVGGTSLTLGSGNSYGSESGWTYSTGGFSGLDSNYRSYETEPSYQTSTRESVGLNDGVRTTPDVSFNADPNSGYAVYDSVSYDGRSGWFQVGGTSAAAPAWAGLIAIIDQGLATGGQGPVSTAQVLAELYSLPSSDFNDITSGSNGYSATTGYDLVNGLGSPKANLVAAGLLAAHGVSENTTTSTPGGGNTATSSSILTSSSSPTSSRATSHHASHAHSHHTRIPHTKIQHARINHARIRRIKYRQTKTHRYDLLFCPTNGSGTGSGSSIRSGSSSPGSGSSSSSSRLLIASSSSLAMLGASGSDDSTSGEALGLHPPEPSYPPHPIRLYQL